MNRDSQFGNLWLEGINPIANVDVSVTRRMRNEGCPVNHTWLHLRTGRHRYRRGGRGYRRSKTSEMVANSVLVVKPIARLFWPFVCRRRVNDNGSAITNNNNSFWPSAQQQLNSRQSFRRAHTIGIADRSRRRHVTASSFSPFASLTKFYSWTDIGRLIVLHPVTLHYTRLYNPRQ